MRLLYSLVWPDPLLSIDPNSQVILYIEKMNLYIVRMFMILKQVYTCNIVNLVLFELVNTQGKYVG